MSSSPENQHIIEKSKRKVFEILEYLLYIFSRVQVLFSTTHGETWHRLHEPCLPGQCVGTYFPVNTLYEAVDFDG